MNLLHKVEEAMMQYGGNSRRSIGEFILKEKNNLHKYSLQEIADQTYTSKAAVVRFAQAVGRLEGICQCLHRRTVLSGAALYGY